MTNLLAKILALALWLVMTFFWRGGYIQIFLVKIFWKVWDNFQISPKILLIGIGYWNSHYSVLSNYYNLFVWMEWRSPVCGAAFHYGLTGWQWRFNEVLITEINYGTNSQQDHSTEPMPAFFLSGGLGGILNMSSIDAQALLSCG